MMRGITTVALVAVFLISSYEGANAVPAVAVAADADASIPATGPVDAPSSDTAGDLFPPGGDHDEHAEIAALQQKVASLADELRELQTKGTGVHIHFGGNGDVDHHHGNHHSDTPGSPSDADHHQDNYPHANEVYVKLRLAKHHDDDHHDDDDDHDDHGDDHDVQAHCEFMPNRNADNLPYRIMGALHFTKKAHSDKVTVQSNIRNLPPNERHAIHVHSLGDMTECCNTLGDHYNPSGHTHGSHASGDLGHAEGADDGLYQHSQELHVDIHDLLGRSVAIHGPDDGDSTTKYACCVIGLVNQDDHHDDDDDHHDDHHDDDHHGDHHDDDHHGDRHDDDHHGDRHDDDDDHHDLQAHCEVMPNMNADNLPYRIMGSVHFTQKGHSDDVSVDYSIRHLPPNERHAIHLHSLGDMTECCNTLGDQYNPSEHTHGSSANGDLGHAEGNDDGLYTHSDRLHLDLHQLLGRSVAIHGPDGDDSTTKYACCVIGRVNEDDHHDDDDDHHGDHHDDDDHSDHSDHHGDRHHGRHRGGRHHGRHHDRDHHDDRDKNHHGDQDGHHRRRHGGGHDKHHG